MALRHLQAGSNRATHVDASYTMTHKDEGKMRGLRADTKPDVACFDG